MEKIDLLNFIPVLRRKFRLPEAFRQKCVFEAAAALHQSCPEQALKSYAEWARETRKNSPIPRGHPYRKLLERRKVPPDHPLWTVGSLAFGTKNPLVVFSAIHWPDGTMDFPERLNDRSARKKTSS